MGDTQRCLLGNFETVCLRSPVASGASQGRWESRHPSIQNPHVHRQLPVRLFILASHIMFHFQKGLCSWRLFVDTSS